MWVLITWNRRLVTLILFVVSWRVGLGYLLGIGGLMFTVIRRGVLVIDWDGGVLGCG